MDIHHLPEGSEVNRSSTMAHELISIICDRRLGSKELGVT